MDRQNTLNYFFDNTNETMRRFMTILDNCYTIANSIDLGKFLDKECNLSKPKVIDNAIISHESKILCTKNNPLIYCKEPNIKLKRVESI